MFTRRGVVVLGRLAATLAFAAGAAPASASDVVRSVEELSRLRIADLHRPRPLDLTLTILMYRPEKYRCWGQDGSVGVYIECGPNLKFDVGAGDRVRVVGEAIAGLYHGNIKPSRMVVIGKPGLPAPLKATAEDLRLDRYPNALVSLEANLVFYRSARQNQPGLVLLKHGDDFWTGDAEPGSLSPDMLGGSDVEGPVRLTAIAGTMANGLGQRVRPLLICLSITRSGPPSKPQWRDLPFTRMGALFTHGGTHSTDRVRLEGVISHIDDRRAIVQNGGVSVWVEPAALAGLAQGDSVEMAGWPRWNEENGVTLAHAVVARRLISLPAPEPRRVTKLEDWLVNGVSSEVVRMSAVVLGQWQDSSNDTLLLREAEGKMGFSAVLRKSEHRKRPLPAFVAGDRVEVTGYMSVEPGPDGFRVNPRLVLADGAAVRLVARSPWWERTPWLRVSAAIGGALVLALAWAALLRRQVKRQTSDLSHKSAELEKAMEEVRLASRAKTDFLANMSHEIRTPLNGVLGMLGLALQHPMSEQQREDLACARSSAEALLGILNDVLDISKIEAGKLRLESAPYDLRAVLREVVRVLSPLAQPKGLQLRLEVDAGVPPLLQGDPLRLRQVVMNLTGNAIKFTERGSVIVRARSEGAQFCIEVEDTGIGIPADKREAIFRAFEQADTSVTRRFGGTGLGLSISSELVRLMGGKLDVASEPGRGSRFFFRLPIVCALDWCVAEKQHTGVRQALRILVAEDNLVNQRLAKRLLEKAGHCVTLAISGAEAVAKVAAEGPFDVILMDVQMPEMSGLEATQRLRADGIQTPIIALTAHALVSDRDACLQAGMTDHMAKPLRERDLAAIIARYCPAEETAPREPALLT